MTKNEAMFVLDHSVEIRIPTQCGDCKKTLPEQIHATLLDDAKRDFGKWFGGFEVTHKHGGYTFPDGTLAEEEVDVVSANCSADALEEHMEELAVFAVRVANELSQDSVALSIDGRMRFYDRTPDAGKCLHAKKGKAVAVPLSVPEGRKAKTDLEKLQALHNALDSFSSLDAAKYVFGELLSYDLTDESLPWRDWPKELKEWLIDAPQVFAYAKGFKIVYLHQSSEQLSKGTTRAVIARIMRDHANAFYGLFVVSNKDASEWELVNARLVDGKANRLILRRILVGTGRGARMATERLQLVDLDGREKFSAQEIQALHDSAFDVEGISKEFYQKIAAWYFWAQKYKGVAYPRNVSSDADQSIFFIRMLTRLIFCWFMRAKGLIPEKLFDLKFIKENLKDSGEDEGAYYKAILQNLFFATLNREINDRSFRRKNDKGLDGNYGVTTLYRYADLMKNPAEMLALFKKVPFVNGGLFECLDDTTKKPEVRLDDFSENGKNNLCIPDELFFGREREIDLSGTYGDKKHKKDSVAGLINILNHYQFTVEENTPLDQAVALDPELLGKVFENLLASYNEETKTTARKALGAFYTPREIVDYMVDESLLAYLKGKLPDASEEKLRGLLAYNDEPHGLSDDDVETLITAIDHLKVLDPAVGSGAFPMGMLHKLVHVLGKLDPGNEKWKQRQLAKIDDIELREQAERAFRDNPADYGRKLYLIQNCIYGVDIQSVAIQIAKMRFFISLIVDQKQTDEAERNYGILALPNLETNFIAANTLIGINRPQQLSLRNPDIEKKEKELHRVRQDHFNAKTPKTKAKCREKDEKLRTEIAELLKHEGWGDTAARQLANWNPYDQNASSGFFDPEWMFGITDGFDIVIGNPPYLSAVTMSRVAKEKEYFKSKYPSATGAYDIFILFLLKGVELTNWQGVYSWIIPNKFLIAEYAKKTRDILINNQGLYKAIDVSTFNVFKEVGVYPIIILGDKQSKTKFEEVFLEEYEDLEKRTFIKNKSWLKNYKSFKDYGIKIFSGTTGFQASQIKPFIGQRDLKNAIPFIVSGNVDRYYWSNSNVRYMGDFYQVAYIKKDHSIADSKWAFWSNPKIIIAGMTKVIEAVYAFEPVGLGVGIYGIYYFGTIDPLCLTGILNSKFLTYYFKEKFKDKHLAGGYLAINKSTIESLPLVEISLPIQKDIAKKTSQILAAKKVDPLAKTTALEKQIDVIVYELYGLLSNEVAIVETEIK